MKHTVRRVLGEERPQDAALRRRADWGVVDRVDERRYAEHIREQDELLANGGARLSGTSQKFDRTRPFLRCDAIVGDRGVYSSMH